MSNALFLLLTSPADSSDNPGPSLPLSWPPPLVCRVCKISSLGRFQELRVAIQRMRAPKTTRRTPKTFTKTASGGESLYLGLLLHGKIKIIIAMELVLHRVDVFLFYFNTYRPKISFSVMPMSATAIILAKSKRPL